MREIKIKSAVPIYGIAAVWAIYCIIFPLYKTTHYIFLVCAAIAAYTLLSLLFPGKTIKVETPAEPERSGDDKIDALLAEGERAVSEMRALRDAISGDDLKAKIDDIIFVTDKIFKDLLDDPEDYAQVKRFAGYHLPTTIKLLHAYDRFGRSGISGDNLSGSLERIDSALDMILDSYKKLFDSLFENQALDIESDIKVLESMLKREGLSGKDFQ
ncbi:MAG: 5-bromo-4-chloroindolyl phosphate hydrolysis family protein [Oscillospiraceae bacterium]|nr:5-bromo-4-chloroindolyl phosphate hydrolysis family protein [Oscillospiraceae bacterium]